MIHSDSVKQKPAKKTNRGSKSKKHPLGWNGNGAKKPQKETVDKIIHLIENDEYAKNLLLDMIAGRCLKGRTSKRKRIAGEKREAARGGRSRTRQMSGGY